MTLRKFLSALFELALDDGYRLCIWTLKDKGSKFYSNIQSAARYAISRKKDSDVYYGVAAFHPETETKKTDKGGQSRGTKKDVAAIVALHADFDVYKPGVHDDPDLPPDAASVQKIIQKVGAKPTFIIDSGNGLQALWLLDEPWILDSPEEHAKAEELMSRWAATLDQRSRELGWKFDQSTRDYSRVLRCPETYNHKTDELPVCKVIKSNLKERHSIGDLEKLMIDPTLAPSEGDLVAVTLDEKRDKLFQPKHGDGFTLNREAEISTKLLAALEDADPQFKSTWDCSRKFKSSDQSCSTYCLSVASFAANPALAFTNQKIADLVCAFMNQWIRKRDSSYRPTKHGHKWFVNLVYKARFQRGGDEAKKAEELEYEDVMSGSREQQLNFLREQLQIDIQGWEQVGTTEPQYFLLVGAARYPMGGSGASRDQKKFVNRIEGISKGKVFLRTSKKDIWEKVAQALAAITTYADDGESEPKDIVQQWIDRYVSSGGVVPAAQWGTALVAMRPFIRHGKFHCYADKLREYLRSHLSLTLAPRELTKQLKLAGFESTFVNDGRIRKRYWAVSVDDLGIDFEAIREAVLGENNLDDEPPV